MSSTTSQNPAHTQFSPGPHLVCSLNLICHPLQTQPTLSSYSLHPGPISRCSSCYISVLQLAYNSLGTLASILLPPSLCFPCHTCHTCHTPILFHFYFYACRALGLSPACDRSGPSYIHAPGRALTASRRGFSALDQYFSTCGLQHLVKVEKRVVVVGAPYKISSISGIYIMAHNSSKLQLWSNREDNLWFRVTTT